MAVVWGRGLSVSALAPRLAKVVQLPRNMSLPFIGGDSGDSLLQPPARPERQDGPRKLFGIRVYLPEVAYLCEASDKTARERNELLDLAQEASEHARLALAIFNADRTCSWLAPPKRALLCLFMRTLNLLAVEAHMRAGDRCPTTPASLPFYRLVAYLLHWRGAIAGYIGRLRLGDANLHPPAPTTLSEAQPSEAVCRAVEQEVQAASAA